MHKVPKLVLGLGGILFVIGWALILMDPMDVDTPPSSEDWSGTLMFEDSTPTTFEGEFKWAADYYVFVQDGSNVTIEILNSDADDIFWPCELDDECDEFDVDGHINGYHYIGELDFEEEGTGIYNPFTKSGTYEISFTEENGETVNVMIREDLFDVDILVAAGGLISCFAGIIILIIGSILSKVMKENPKVELNNVLFSTMEETDEGAAPEGTTLAGTPNVAPAGDDGGAYGQPEVQYAKRSVVPVIIGAIYSLAQVPLILLALVSILVPVGFPLSTMSVIIAASCVGIYAGILMIQYKKRGIHIALGMIAVGFVMNLIMNFLTGGLVGMELPVSLAKWSICAAFVAVPLLVSGISEQME